ncbi:hypothetical protein WMY93_032234 [Mugilogobius chulae]|uniref:Uncharacterized protein n=1 Tax=Mugilogobius chulae TaxID=88201 RepID=A0AAW0MCG5_9GOBI
MWECEFQDRRHDISSSLEPTNIDTSILEEYISKEDDCADMSAGVSSGGLLCAVSPPVPLRHTTALSGPNNCQSYAPPPPVHRQNYPLPRPGTTAGSGQVRTQRPLRPGDTARVASRLQLRALLSSAGECEFGNYSFRNRLQ